jgi:hypothetical protein
MRAPTLSQQLRDVWRRLRRGKRPVGCEPLGMPIGRAVEERFVALGEEADEKERAWEDAAKATLIENSEGDNEAGGGRCGRAVSKRPTVFIQNEHVGECAILG